MHFTEVSVMEDARAMIAASQGHPSNHYEMEILIGEKVIRITRVLAVNLTRDFISNHFDVESVEFQVGLGTWTHLVLPNKDNIVVKLFIEPCRLEGNGFVSAGSISTRTFKGVIEDSTNEAVTIANETTNSQKEADEAQNVPKTITLITDTINSVRTGQCGGWQLKNDCKTIMQGLFMQVGVKGIPTKEQYLKGEYKGVVGVSVYEPDNKKVYNHTYLQEIFLSRLPAELQKVNGVYNHGIANYLHKGIWYVYPVTNMKRFEEASRRVLIYNIPREKYGNIDKTFCFKGKELNILATGDAVARDTSELRQYNEGNAIRIARSQAIMDQYIVNNGDDKLEASFKDNIMEGILEARKDGLALMKPGIRITGNTCEALTELNKGAVAEYFIEWQNSDATLLSPGQPCRLFYTINDKAVAIDGIIAGIDSRDSTPDQIITKAPFSNTSIIRVIGERVKE